MAWRGSETGRESTFSVAYWARRFNTHPSRSGGWLVWIALSAVGRQRSAASMTPPGAISYGRNRRGMVTRPPGARCLLDVLIGRASRRAPGPARGEFLPDPG